MDAFIDYRRRFIRLWREANVSDLHAKISDLDDYDLHNILRQRNKIEWNEWHLLIEEKDKILKIAQNFHNDFKSLQKSSSIRDQMKIIKETFLEFKSNDNTWNELKNDFEQADKEDNPECFMKAYTRHQLFSKHINKYSAVNTKHVLRLYCTALNCPVLAQTQQYTEAITKIFFHPKLNERLVTNQTVYRGTYLNDETLIADYKEGATIITTTFLSTSTDRQVAEFFTESASKDAIRLFCMYNIKNTNRHTAINVKNLSKFPDEEEVIILRYVPFIIRSIQRMDDGQRIEIQFDECEDNSVIQETHF